MSWAISLGRVAGIEVRLHVTFLILLAWIAIGHFLAGGLRAALLGLTLIAAVFGSVLLHEFGHALAARRFGVRTPDITLLPIGGVARLERLPDKPRQELLVALAGPAVNIGIAALLFLILTALRGGWPAPAGFMRGALLDRILWVNLWLAVFNFIPAFPMDGGRVLRAVLAERLGFARATQLAASVGQAFAFVFATFGFFFNPLLIFIALFVYLGASGELSAAQIKEFAQRVPVQQAMVTRFDTLHRNALLEHAIAAFMQGSQKEFPIIDDAGRVVGMLCREDMIRALSQHGKDVPVTAVMQSRFPAAFTGEMLSGAFERMVTGGHAAIPVIDAEGNLVGLLTRENVAELMVLHDALAKAPPS